MKKRCSDDDDVEYNTYFDFFDAQFWSFVQN